MKQLLFGILLLTLMGCNRPKSAASIPANIIPRDSMIGIFVDIHIADALVDQRLGADHHDVALTNALYERIYQNHHITAAQYKVSFKYYESHPEIFDKMYEQVITEISKKQALMKKAQ